MNPESVKLFLESVRVDSRNNLLKRRLVFVKSRNNSSERRLVRARSVLGVSDWETEKLSYLVGKAEQVVELEIYCIHIAFALCGKIGLVVLAVEVLVAAHNSFFGNAVHPVGAVNPHAITRRRDLLGDGCANHIHAKARFRSVLAAPDVRKEARTVYCELFVGVILDAGRDNLARFFYSLSLCAELHENRKQDGEH